ncbi:MAG: GFA family protein [bacterium]
MKRQLTAILYADAVGYSRHTDLNEESAHAQLNSSLDLLIQLIERTEGKKVHEAGDAILAEFPSIVSAVQTAIDFQKQMATQNNSRSSDNRFEFRVGVNLGDVIHDRGDIYGDGVNLAARIQELAEPGGIAISGAAFEQTKATIIQPFHDLGYQKLKNISEPVHVYSLDISDIEGATHPAAFLNASIKGQPLFDLNGVESESTSTNSGSCLCGQVSYEISEPQVGAGFCHCRICQRALGAPINAWVAFPDRAVHFWQRKPTYYQSSVIAERGFCPNCGTSLTYRMLKPSLSDYLILCIATLNNPGNIAPVWHGGVESQLPWLNLHDDLPRMQTKDSPSLRNAWASVGLDDPDKWMPKISNKAKTKSTKK